MTESTGNRFGIGLRFARSLSRFENLAGVTDCTRRVIGGGGEGDERGGRGRRGDREGREQDWVEWRGGGYGGGSRVKR